MAVKFKYRVGTIEIQGTNINDLKEFAELMYELAGESGMDLPKHLNDVCFGIEWDYQRFYNLDENNWDIVH